jgi:hypothetical protein
MVGAEVLQQLGGPRFQSMTGARDFVWQNDGLAFRLPRTQTGIAHITVTMASNDTYTVTFCDHRLVEVAKVSDLFAEQLRDTMAHHIGIMLD